MKSRALIVLTTIGMVMSPALAAAKENAPLVVQDVSPGFSLASQSKVAIVYVDPQDAATVHHAADDLAADIASVTGLSPQVVKAAPKAGETPVIIGTLGRNAIINRLVSESRLDVSGLSGAWESFVIATVDDPFPGVKKALVIAGSDRRGTAFGVYELSEAIGVSPWAWWADVTPEKKTVLTVPDGTHRFGPPSVKYRGIFINDEDWGLTPWAARTFDPELGNIGPKTYERVFELLLRLKANTLWPAMHKSSTAFNAIAENARLADEYGIVMGSSHAEPMLRNNVREWSAPKPDYNYVSNPEGVRAYWEERVKTNADYESIWTLGMRGIHDSGMVGANSPEESVRILDGIIADQRDLLTEHSNRDLSDIPQMFVPYKEVLDIYRNGLSVPEDVTLLWTDDNFGYIRQFSNAQERQRSGGAGVYYHLSYLGQPLAYLWLSTTPPSLVQEEMTRAYDQGAQSIWIANVGDIKPAEIGMSHFLELAWDIDATRQMSQREWLNDWSARTFGAGNGEKVGGLLDRYFRLNFERRPEHLSWPHNGWQFRTSPYSAEQAAARLRRFTELVDETEAAGATIPELQQDAWFQIVDYPVRASSAANLRFFATELYLDLVDRDTPLARSAAGAARMADEEIKALTNRYNFDIADGKWRYMMAEEPADAQWQRFRVPPVVLAPPGLTDQPDAFMATIASASLAPDADTIEAEASSFGPQWRLVTGLGRGDGTLIANGPGASLTRTITIEGSDPRSLAVGLLPLFPHGEERVLKITVQIDGGATRQFKMTREPKTPEWSEAVLDNLLKLRIADRLAPGEHTVTVTAGSTGIAVDQFLLGPEHLPSEKD